MKDKAEDMERILKEKDKHGLWFTKQNWVFPLFLSFYLPLHVFYDTLLVWVHCLVMYLPIWLKLCWISVLSMNPLHSRGDFRSPYDIVPQLEWWLAHHSIWCRNSMCDDNCFKDFLIWYWCGTKKQFPCFIFKHQKS